MTSTTFHVDAALFEMDGTLVDSTAGLAGAWDVFKQKYPNIDVDHILSSAHGVRTVDNLKNYCGITDPDELQSESERFEIAIVASASANGRRGFVLLPGVAEVIDAVAPGRFLPNPSWAICTSATRKYATAALNATGVPIPDAFVVSEDVKQGKPYPDPYLLGAEKCGVKPEHCVVFEDAPAGLRSGKAAGCKTIGFLTTHSKEQMEATQPDFLVQDMSNITIRRVESGGLDITIFDLPGIAQSISCYAMCPGTALARPSGFSKLQAVADRILLVLESPKVEEPCTKFTTGGEMAAVLKEHINDSPHGSFRSGTVEFISASLQTAMNDKEEYLQSPVDDLHSFYWVAQWAVLFNNHNKSHRSQKEHKWQEYISDGQVEHKMFVASDVKRVHRRSEHSPITMELARFLKEWHNTLEKFDLDWIHEVAFSDEAISGAGAAEFLEKNFHTFALRGVLDFSELVKKHAVKSQLYNAFDDK